MELTVQEGAATYHELRSSSFELNMAGWCTEKAESVVMFLVELVDVQRKASPPIPGCDAAHVVDAMGLRAALWNATKLLSFGCGSAWDPSDVDLIEEKGMAGFIQVSAKYGSPCAAHLEAQREMKQAFVDKIVALLDGPRAPNRTFIHEALLVAEWKHEGIQDLVALTDEVSMGNIEWPTYCDRARVIARRLYQLLETTRIVPAP